jgi:hypothetical protein
LERVRERDRRLAGASDGDLGWHLNCALYAYCTVDYSEILYIGKTDGTTVRRRWNRSAKEAFWEARERERRILRHAALLGEIVLERQGRLTRELVADIESLLIMRVKPWGKIQCLSSRISRPGLQVMCVGESPLARREFRDT